MNDNSSGCLGIVLGFIFLGGNLFLFTGALADDLSDNGIAWFMVIAAIIADIIIAGLLLSKLISHLENKSEQKRVEKEKAIKDAIREFWNVYEPKYKASKETNDINFKSNELIYNKEIIECVKRYQNKNSVIYESLTPIYNKIYQILNQSKEFSEKEQTLNFLKNNEEQLIQLKENCDAIIKKLHENKIEILNKYGKGTDALSNAFIQIKASKKIIEGNNAIPLDNIIQSEYPIELSTFNFKLNSDKLPLTLNLHKLILCFFERLILVFNKEGCFMTAIDPSMLKIKITRLQCDVTISNGNMIENEFIASDSKCIRTGYQRTTWLHTCRDGSPDLRYSYNPRMEYRTDTMEYGVVEIRILNYSFSYTISSAKALDAIEKAKNTYCISYEKYHNPLPSLMKLFEVLLKSNEKQFGSIASQQLLEDDGYFCKIVNIV